MEKTLKYKCNLSSNLRETFVCLFDVFHMSFLYQNFTLVFKVVSHLFYQENLKRFPNKLTWSYLKKLWDLKLLVILNLCV